MKIWAIADLHFSFGVPNKNMDVFGKEWENHPQKIQVEWEKKVGEEDLILIAGDISWAKKTHEVLADLMWLDSLKGKKIFIKGNHDYWWSSLSKVNNILPSSCYAIQNNALSFNGISIGGARLWDTEEYDFDELIDFRSGAARIKSEKERMEDKRIFERELERLELSLREMDPKASVRIAMTHYPPLGADLKASRASRLLEKYKIDICVFGHLHCLKKGLQLFGKKAGGVKYFLTACDYIHFSPFLIYPS